MSNENWREVGQSFAQAISDRYPVTLASRDLTERLTQFTVTPSKSGAADLSLTVSPFEVIVEFGACHNRIELPPLPDSESRLNSVVNAVACGGLAESKRKWLSRYRLNLSDGSVLRGGSIRGLPLGPQVRTYGNW
jgi:hypothetical protein